MSRDGAWSEMFGSRGNGGRGPADLAPSAPSPDPERQPEDEQLGIDLSEYRPWILQRVRNRPALMLDMRRYEPRSGLWCGWQMSYPSLIAVEYTGDRLLTLDFGTRQFAVEGKGLDQLTPQLRAEAVLTILEHSAEFWPQKTPEVIVQTIRQLGVANSSRDRI